MNKLEVKINPKDFLRSYDIWFHKRISDTQMAVGLPMALEAKDFAAGMTFDPLPTMSVQPETLQCLIDELWNIGFRPSLGFSVYSGSIC